jgi:hypothetical protein
MAAQRTWYTAGIAAAGLHMMFMGTEWAQTGWWHTDEHHRLQWQMAEDKIGKTMMEFMRCVSEFFSSSFHRSSSCLAIVLSMKDFVQLVVKGKTVHSFRLRPSTSMQVQCMNSSV